MSSFRSFWSEVGFARRWYVKAASVVAERKKGGGSEILI